jgi:hypothetical protein
MKTLRSSRDKAGRTQQQVDVFFLLSHTRKTITISHEVWVKTGEGGAVVPHLLLNLLSTHALVVDISP